MPDDMGGADHVDVTVRLSDNTSQYYPNISQNGIWLANYHETVFPGARIPFVITAPLRQRGRTELEAEGGEPVRVRRSPRAERPPRGGRPG